MRKERIQELLLGYAAETLTDNERTELYHFLKDGENEALFVDTLIHINSSSQNIDIDESYLSILDKVYKLDQPQAPLETSSIKSFSPVREIHFIRSRFVRYAAAILILFGSFVYFWVKNRYKEDLATKSIGKSSHEDINPGGNKATLTLSDGTTITLDSVANGMLAQQGDVAIVKMPGAQIMYSQKGRVQEDVMMNTMATPRGGQYQLVLPDGSKVWLNAASSITFPVVFTGNERRVKITGEVYLEVAKNKEKPFLLDADGKATVQVLGTRFNINSYANESSITTTLIEGSVKIAVSQPFSSGSNTKFDSPSVILTPGQQAKLFASSLMSSSAEQFKVIDGVSTDQALAWKNGFFSLQDASFMQVTRQLERWYDIQVRYESTIPNVQFKGKMNRGVKLSTIISWFSDLGINTRLEGKTLIVF